MRTNERFRFVAVVGVVIAMLTAGISLAGDALDAGEDTEPTTCQPTDQTSGGGAVSGGDEVVVDGSGDVVQGDDAAGTSDETEEPADDEGEAEEPADDEGEAEEPADDEGETEEPSDDEAGAEECDDADAATAKEPRDEVAAGSAPEPSAEHLKACADAVKEADVDLGLDPEQAPVPGEKHGLENAISHVFWNCVHHENLGLPNALDHLVHNFNEKLRRDELKAERAAEREAAKAEREAAREAAKAERAAARAAAKAEREAARANR